MDKRTRDLRSSGKGLTPIVNIGKNGVTQGVIDLIDRELEQKQLIKIKLLKGALPAAKADKKALAQEIAEKTDAKIIEQVGNIVVLHRT